MPFALLRLFAFVSVCLGSWTTLENDLWRFLRCQSRCCSFVKAIITQAASGTPLRTPLREEASYSLERAIILPFPSSESYVAKIFVRVDYCFAFPQTIDSLVLLIHRFLSPSIPRTHEIRLRVYKRLFCNDLAISC